MTSRRERRRKSARATQVGVHLSTQSQRGDQNPLSNISKEDTKADRIVHYKIIHTEQASLEVRSLGEKMADLCEKHSCDITFKF